MPSCAAFGCSNRSENGFCMKVFPKDPQRRAMWAAKVKRDCWQPTNNSYLCEVHFSPDQWEKVRVDGKKKLKLSAVPTVFFHQTLPKPRRKSPMKRNGTSNPLPYTGDHTYSSKKPRIEPDEPVIEDNILVEEDSVGPDLHFETTPEDSDLKKRIKTLENELELRANTIRSLRRKIRVNIVAKSRKRGKEEKVSKCLRKICTENQLEALSKNSTRGFSWDKITVKKALQLKFACGSSGYEELLRQGQPLPSLRTLRRKLQKITFHSGILDEVFNMLAIKVSSMKNAAEKECVLVLDELFLTEGISYDIATKSFIGNVTLPDHEGTTATHGLVFMLGGVSSRWKQTVAYYFTSNSVNGRTFKPIIDEIIMRTEKLGLRVNSVTSDMGSCNQAMWSSYGVYCCPGPNGKIRNYTRHPSDPSRKLYFLPDVPHLFKNIKQALLKNKFIKVPQNIVEKYRLPSDTVECCHIEELAKHQDDLELKLVRKLQLEDLNPNHFDKMKVSKATNVISRDVGASLNYLVDNEGYHSSFKTTAWFVESVAKWFSLMTSRHPGVALSKNNPDKYEESLKFLRDFMDIFKNIRIGSKGSWKPCQSGVLLATQSILDLQDMFLNEKQFKFLLTSRFTQDCLENLFSCIRSIQPIPNALQFKSSLKLVCVAQYLKSVSNGSYDQDDREFLGEFLDLTPKTQENEKSDVGPELCPGFEEAKPVLNNTEQNCLYNIAGYILSRVENNDKVCQNCLESVCCDTPPSTSYSAFVKLKEFKSGSLKHVTENCFSFFLQMELMFRKCRALILANQRKVFLKKLKIAVAAHRFAECHSIKFKMLNRYIEFRCKNLGSFRSKELKKTIVKGSCFKASKSVAMREAVKNG